MKKDCEKLQAKGDLAANHRGQSWNSNETNVTLDFSNGGDVMLTLVSDMESKPDEEWILLIGIYFKHMRLFSKVEL